MMPDSSSKVKPQRPPKRRTGTVNDITTRLVREAHRLQDRRGQLNKRLEELRPGLRSTLDQARLPHPKGIDPAEAGRIAAQLQDLELQVQPLVDALEAIP